MNEKQRSCVWSAATTMKSMEEDKEPSTESVYGHYVGGVKVE